MRTIFSVATILSQLQTLTQPHGSNRTTFHASARYRFPVVFSPRVISFQRISRSREELERFDVYSDQRDFRDQDEIVRPRLGQEIPRLAKTIIEKCYRVCPCLCSPFFWVLGRGGLLSSLNFHWSFIGRSILLESWITLTQTSTENNRKQKGHAINY